MLIFSPLNVMLHLGKNQDKNLRRVLTIIMILSSKHFTENLLKSGVNVICVPVLAVGVSSLIFVEERLLAHSIFIFPLPSHVIHSKAVEKILAALIPIPLVPIVFLLSSLKFEPDIVLHTALTHIHSPASFFFTGIPLPLSSIEKVFLSIFTLIFVEYSQLVLIPSSIELSI